MSLHFVEGRRNFHGRGKRSKARRIKALIRGHGVKCLVTKSPGKAPLNLPLGNITPTESEYSFSHSEKYNFA